MSESRAVPVPGSPPELSPTKRAIVEIRELRAKLAAADRSANEPIAIVGLGCRFPGADGPEAYWRLLRAGTDAISKVPLDRWDVDALYDPDPDAPGKIYARYGGFLEQVDRFDAAFFGISPREAVSLDPQQRLLLEVAWEALEHGAIGADSLVGTSGGVFLGLTAAEYGTLHLTGATADITAYVGTGNALSVAAGRLSYVLGLQGPCMAVDTACSSSLVAVHLACQSLRRDECRIALAGGANVILRPEPTVNFCRARMLSPDGRCKTFDAAADGYSRGEGVGIIVLKRLSQAIADGNRVLAVILGSAVNQDGRSGGLTVPNGVAQERLIRDALASARLQPSDVSYIEAHGTGTSLGDPIEMHSLRSVFAPGRQAEHPLVIGSAKTNFGHLEAAAGVAGLIKVVLALQHGEIPRHLHFERLNPHIDLTGFPAVIPTELRDWTHAAGTRVAGVSAFGFSGTNAHLLVAEADPTLSTPSAGDTSRSELAVLSARTPSALRMLARRLADHLADADVALADVTFTASVGRAHLHERIALVAGSRLELSNALRRFADNVPVPALTASQLQNLDPVPVAFHLGPATAGSSAMAHALCRESRVFNDAFVRVTDLLRPHVREAWDPAGPAIDSLDSDATSFALQVALIETWRSWGVEAAAVGGVGVGECVAAWTAGIFTIDEAAVLVTARTRAMQTGGASGIGDLALAEFGRIVSGLACSTPHTEFVPSTAGDLSSGDDPLQASYWMRRLVEGKPADGSATALRQHGIVLDLGSLTERVAANEPTAVWSGVLETLGRLYLQGAAIAWNSVYAGRELRRLQLPTYPFERERYWIPPASAPPAPVDRLSFTAVVDSARRQADQAPLDLRLEGVPSRTAALDELTTAFVVSAFHTLGVFDSLQEPLSLDSLVERHGILPVYRKVVERWLERLAALGILARSGNFILAPPTIADPRLDEFIARTKLLFDDAPELMQCVITSGRSLVPVLTGKRSAIDALFPDGSFDVAEALYERAPTARYVNAVVAAIVAKLAASGDGEPLQVLEIGAGTGGTAAALLPVLRPDCNRYYFTDLSSLFLLRAEDRFRAYPFVRYGLLDIEQDPAPQGFPNGAWDVIVAANVLHATRDLRQTLRHVRELLAPAGVLILVELTTHPAWFDLLLIEGWQRYEDDVRTTSPVLPPDRWRQVLAETAFIEVATVPETGSPAGILGQHVILARASTGRDGSRRVNVSAAGSSNSFVPVVADEAAADFLRRLHEALPEDCDELLVGYVRAQVGRVLRLEDGSSIDRRHRLMDLGLDSLMAVELRGLLARGLLVKTLPATLIFDYPTVDAITKYLSHDILGLLRPDPSAPIDYGSETGDVTAAAAVEDLSDDEVEVLLLERLKSLKGNA